MIRKIIALAITVTMLSNMAPHVVNCLFGDQIKTMNSVEKLDENIYMMDYQNDYKLDKLLKKGVSSLVELLGFAATNITFGVNAFKIGDAEFGCTTFNAFNKDGDNLLGRNFDYKEAPCMVVWTHPDNGYASLSMVDCNFMLYGNINKPGNTYDKLQLLLAPYCCVDGINEKGVSIAVLELKADATNQKTDNVDLTTTTMIRTVLDKAATVEEAIDIFSTYDLHDSFFCCYHYHITDASGKSVVIEYVNNEMRVIEADEPAEGGKDYQYAANCFISDDAEVSEEFGSSDRIKIVSDELKSTQGILSESDAVKLLSKVKLNYRHKTGLWQVITLWSSVYNCNDKTMTIAAGLDYDNVYTLSVTEPYKVK